MSNIGVLGGTFDPFHLGHLSIVEAATSEFNFEKILLMPAKVSPFKIGRKMASEEDRIGMVRSVADAYEKVEVTTIETEREEVSYTYETMKRLKDVYPDDKLWFIIGTDSLLSLDTWYMGEKLLRSFPFVLAPRPGYSEAESDEKILEYHDRYGTEIFVLHNELRDISSSAIKQAIKEGESIADLVPETVNRYIQEHGLYR